MLRSDFSQVTVVFQQLELFLLFLVFYNLFLSRGVIAGALFAFAISCGVSSALMLSGVSVDAFQRDMLAGRVSAFGENPNVYARILAVGALSALGLAHVRTYRRTLRVPLLWGITLVTAAGVVSSGSRGMTLALAVGLGTFALRTGPLSVRLRNLLFVTASVGVLALVATRSEVLIQRWTETEQTGSTSGRILIYATATEMVLERPVAGWGAEAAHELARRLSYPGEIRATHNTVLAVLTLTGLLGAIPFLWGLWAVFRASWIARSGAERTLPLTIFVALFVADMATGGLPEKIHWAFYAYILAASELTRLPLKAQHPRRRSYAAVSGSSALGAEPSARPTPGD